eukprot:GEMP01057998.1.p1 GENE.GEMP01057998.1~~GEMP01057998.1.p1  ORF type:complete len:200 (+),score=30.16 GEMP01057998.1:54-602(+)
MGETDLREEASASVDAEIEAIQREIEAMDEEAEHLADLTTLDNVDTIDSTDVDKRSVYVGNVDYGSTPEELQEHFRACGAINRITILVDKYTGTPKGYAYVEFADELGVANAVLLNDSLFRARQLKVFQKRTNIPGMGAKGKKGKDKGKGSWAAPIFVPSMYAPYWGKGKGKGKGPKGAKPY